MQFLGLEHSASFGAKGSENAIELQELSWPSMTKNLPQDFAKRLKRDYLTQSQIRESLIGHYSSTVTVDNLEAQSKKPRSHSTKRTTLLASSYGRTTIQ